MRDEEYFFATLVGSAAERTAAGAAAWADLARAMTGPERQGLLRRVVDQFGQIILPDGNVIVRADMTRLRRVVWKIVRGLYFVDTSRVLLEATQHATNIYTPEMYGMLPPVFELLRGARSRAHSPHIFDYRVTQDPGWIYYGLIFWEAVIALVVFRTQDTN